MDNILDVGWRVGLLYTQLEGEDSLTNLESYNVENQPSIILKVQDNKGQTFLMIQ